jgi:hypothetical protein
MKRLIVVCLSVFVAMGAFADARGDEIARKYFDQKTPRDTTAVASMTIRDQAGVVKTRKLKMVMKETPEGRKTFVEFVEPADVSGTKFLTVSRKGAETDQRLYLPALKKIRKISSSSKDGEFVGSDLFYFDMEERFFEDASYSFLGENETLTEPALAGMKFWKISMELVNSNAPYAKCIAWINMQDLAMYRTECYDKKDGALFKTITVDETKAIKGYTIPVKETVVNLKKGSQTQMAMGGFEVETGVKDSEISVKRLEQ